ncbi:hypothetical protein V1508DRAFT_434709 [Lipomyces doorenjongii]|uniref:uncharacterized protein n=1 Tax=Lipomyces doorenjongii TaxID=383834 RepID=UPI0034CE9D02
MEKRIRSVIEQINGVNPTVDVRFYQLDLADLDSVRSAAEKINASIDKIDVLINYAAIMAVKDFETSKEAIEIQFATTHIGFLLTNLLMPKLEAASPGARIIMCPAVVTCSPRSDLMNFQDGKSYIPWLGYAQSKTANILFTVDLAARLKKRGIYSFSLHPGLIYGTNLGLHLDEQSFKVLTDIALDRDKQ